jgi:hypothetical protein
MHVPDVESQWRKKAFKWGCLFGFLFWFGAGLLAMILGLCGGALDDYFGGLLGSGLMMIVSSLVLGPLFGLGCACLVFVLEILFKTTWWTLRRKAPGRLPADANRRFCPGSDNNPGKAEITRDQEAPANDSGIRDGSNGSCPPPGNGAEQG